MCIKFIVLIFYFREVILHQMKYCDICVNHTLCKYKNPGPSNTCIGYDKNALLTKRDVEDILDRINNRRNFIALGNLKYLPGAANMKKMEWSPELATMAQRWADQCDPSIFPDKPDQCRDTDRFKVGQNIATISGLAPGVNMKSFIDMWFIESLDYIGSVSYYNQSRDNKTNYFTQLIWAETDKVGCGKVRFYITHPRYILIERLVCNFAPKGNIHGKPIYAIGYPSTQCAANFTADLVFSGLCSFTGSDKAERKGQKSELNLQDMYFRRLRLPNSLKKGQNNICGINNTQCKRDRQSQNVQNIKNFLVAVKRSQSDDQWLDQNASKNIERQQHEKGHSRVYNNHNHKLDFDSIHPSSNQDLRKYDAVISSVTPLLVQDYRRHNINKKCTRRHGIECNDNTSTQSNLCLETSNRCTRGERKLCPSPTMSARPNLCPCNTQNIQCSSPATYQNICRSNLLKSLIVSRNNNNNVVKRNNTTADLDSSEISQSFDSKVDYEYYLSLPQEDSLPSKTYTTNHVSSINIDSFEPNYSERLRRETEEVYTAEPFYQMDVFLTPNQLQLKGLRYTTITNKKHKNKKPSKISKTLDSKTPTTTEFITITKDIPAKEKSLTEKYLSFDELLHLRKFNADNYNLRRANPSEPTGKSTEPTTVSEYTANTPFIRMKHCTRRLTCTWTADLLTDSAGNPRFSNGNMGRNTPPGYVEGCTRTSTCTRDYMQRNKMPSTINDFTPSIDSSTNGDDEDYCERRSLNKRDLLNNFLSKKEYERKLITDDVPLDPLKQIKQKKENIANDYIKTNIINYIPSNRYARKEKNDKSIISYGDLYYFVVQKLVESWQKKRKLFPNKKCACNSSNTIDYGINLFIFVSAWYIPW